MYLDVRVGYLLDSGLLALCFGSFVFLLYFLWRKDYERASTCMAIFFMTLGSAVNVMSQRSFPIVWIGWAPLN